MGIQIREVSEKVSKKWEGGKEPIRAGFSAGCSGFFIEGDNGDLIKKETSSKSPREIRHLVLPTEKHCI